MNNTGKYLFMCINELQGVIPVLSLNIDNTGVVFKSLLKCRMGD
jgi:hypothetical protein